MDGCSNNQFEKLLYAYELGLLLDQEREALEIHLLECDSCFEQLQRFSAAARHLRFDPAVRDKTRELVGRPEEAAEAPVGTGRGRLSRWRRWPTLLRPGLAAALIIALILLKPWQIEIKPTQEAIAARNRIAVLEFKNLAEPDDPEHLGDIATNLLITDLSESSYLQVLSSQRIDDILKLLGEPETKAVDKNTAAEIARQASAKWILEGDILQVEPSIILTSQLIDAASDEVIASSRVSGQPGETIFSLVDRLTVDVKRHLSLPASAQAEPDKMVADVTTHSPEAYRYYLDGLNKYNRYYFNEAAASFETALKYDSTFASAYYHLCILKKGEQGYYMIKKAKRYSDKTSHKERMYINSLYAMYTMKKEEAISILEKMVTRYPDEKEAFMLLGGYLYGDLKYDQAIRCYSEVIKIDPLYESPYNMLAYSYDKLGEFDKSIEAINKYISLAPDEPNPFDSRGELYARHGRLDEAIESYQEALQRKPDFDASIINLGVMLCFKGRYLESVDYFHRYINIGGKTERPTGRLYLACIPIYRGDVAEGLRRLEEGLGADRLELANPTTVLDYTTKILLKARLLAEQGRTAEAVEEFEKYMLSHMTAYPGSLADFWYLYIQLLAENGDIEKARRSAEEMKKLLEYRQSPLAPYHYSMGCIEFETNHPDSAVFHFEAASAQNPTFTTDYMLARAYQAAGEKQKAIAKFEELISSYTTSRFLFSIWSVKMHYYLGRLYDETGQREKAAQQYETFIDLWKNASAWPEAVDYARKRLAVLTRR